MVWTNPETLTPEEIQAELAQVELKLTEARKSGGKILELETHKWRLQFEQRYLMTADEVSQSERRRVLENDRKVMSSYLDHARSSVDDERGGRWAAASPTRTVVGTSPVSYPRQPKTSPANQAAIVGDEAPLGYDINAMEPVGEFHERGDAAGPDEGGDGGLRRRGWRRL
jgi:hypothetical protein